MAFFNYSTMQMTAKVVYYGPGLGGKTTNLEFIHGHTTENSRGEMVSLETQTDRTLFFDLLPLEVGTVVGFHTKIQLYTVPGQVFYNTTRKLVLKGVDGVVFVADSQKPMMKANVESLQNLDENLKDLGLSLDSVPLVLQYNKRDLEEVNSVEEMDEQLNKASWPRYEASALYGKGVFETLQGICRLTLLALKKQLETTTGFGAKPARAKPAAAPRKKPAARPAARSKPAAAAPKSKAKPAAARPAPPAAQPARQAAAVGTDNGRARVSRDLLLRLTRSDFERTRRVLISLQLQDRDQELVHEVRNLQWDIAHRPSLEELLLRLNIALNPKD